MAPDTRQSEGAFLLLPAPSMTGEISLSLWTPIDIGLEGRVKEMRSF